MATRFGVRPSVWGVVLSSPLRFIAAGLALGAGFAHVLEAEDQFHRSVWFGVAFAAITGLWFVVGSFLTMVDTLGVWCLAIAQSIASLLAWMVSFLMPVTELVDDTGQLDEPLTGVRIALAVLVAAAAVTTVAAVRPDDPRGGPAALRRWARHGRAIRLAGIVAFVLALAVTAAAAAAQGYQSGEAARAMPVRAGKGPANLVR